MTQVMIVCVDGVSRPVNELSVPCAKCGKPVDMDGHSTQFKEGNWYHHRCRIKKVRGVNKRIKPKKDPNAPLTPESALADIKAIIQEAVLDSFSIERQRKKSAEILRNKKFVASKEKAK